MNKIKLFFIILTSLLLVTFKVSAEEECFEKTSRNIFKFNMGFDMKKPAGQHPSRPVDVKSLLEDKDCH